MDNRSANPVQPSAWDAVRTLVQQEVAEGVYDTWLRPTRGLATVGNVLRVGVPNEMFAEWLRSQYLALIRTAMTRSGLGHMQVEFVPPIGAAVATAPAAAPPVASAAARPAGPETPRLNPRYSFDGFVVSSCNQLPTPPRWRSATSRAGPTTRSSSTAGSGWARPTSCRRSGTGC